MKVFTFSDVNAFKNNYGKCIKFLGTFLFCCSFGFSASDTLKEDSIVHKKLASEAQGKLMTYEKSVCARNEISKSGLKHARMPNYEIIASPGMIPCWETIQGAANSYYHNLCVKDWDTNDTMSIVIDDDKYHLNHKVSTDNLRLTRHVRDRRFRMVNHDVALKEQI